MKNFLFFLATALVALAQGSGSVQPPQQPRGISDAELPPFRVTKTVHGTVHSIAGRVLSIEDAKTAKIIELRLATEKVRVGGLGAKQLSDVAIGANVRVSYAADDKSVLDVRLYVPKSAKKKDIQQ